MQRYRYNYKFYIVSLTVNIKQHFDFFSKRHLILAESVDKLFLPPYNVKMVSIFKFVLGSERDMGARGCYRTKQQERILSYLMNRGDTFLTADAVLAGLRDTGVSVGLTTVYRALERLSDQGVVVKVPALDGSRAQYRYTGPDQNPSSGKLVCLSCGKTQLLECARLETLTRHIQEDHQFEIDPRRTVLYGLCKHCRANQAPKGDQP